MNQETNIQYLTEKVQKYEETTKNLQKMIRAQNNIISSYESLCKAHDERYCQLWNRSKDICIYGRSAMVIVLDVVSSGYKFDKHDEVVHLIQELCTCLEVPNDVVSEAFSKADAHQAEASK
jgi:hypothetical protein